MYNSQPNPRYDFENDDDVFGFDYYHCSKKRRSESSAMKAIIWTAIAVASLGIGYGITCFIYFTIKHLAQ